MFDVCVIEGWPCRLSNYDDGMQQFAHSQVSCVCGIQARLWSRNTSR